MNERSDLDERLSVSRFVLSTLLPFSLLRLPLLPSFSLCRRNSFSAGLDGQASYANCRFFWPENQLWPTVQQVSWWWVTANFYLRAWEQGRQEKREGKREREGEEEEEWVREGARGVQRAGESLLVHPGKTRPHRQPLYVDSTRCLVSLIFFLSFSPFFSIRTRRPL